jgi:putative hemolysin
LWSALANYAIEGGYQYLLGCASITPGPSGYAVDAVFRHIEEKNLAPLSLTTTPTIPVPQHLRCQRDESGIPPLLKTYLRLGALVCGEPFWDEDFNCMDLLILLPLEILEQRYSKHYLKVNQPLDESKNSVVL